MDHSKNSTAELETLGFASQVFFVSLYSLTALCAFASNLVTIVVLIKGRRCTRDLRKFLINLSVADLLMSFTTIPFTYTNYMFGRWIFWPIMCPIVNMAQLTTITVSVFTLVAIAIDRYFAIMHPLQRSISWFKAHRALIVLVIWVFGITIGLTQVWVSKTGSFVFKTGVTYNTCGERWLPESMEGQIYTGFIFTVTFALPMAILSVVYSAMGCRLLRYRMPGQLLSQSTCYGGSGNSLRSPEQSDLFAEGGGGGGGGGGHTANAHHHSATTKNSSLRKSVSSNGKLCTKSDKSRLLLVVPNSGEGAELNQQQHNNEQQPKSQTKKRPERQSTENIAAAHPLTNTYDNDVKENYSGKTIDGEKCHMGDAQTPPKEASSPPKINEPMGRNGSRGKEKQFAKSTTAVSNGHCLGKAKCTTASVNYRFVAQTGGNTASAAEVLLPSSSGNFATVKRKASSGGSSNSSSIKAAHQHNQHHQHSHHPHHQQNHQHNHYSHKIINIRRNKVLKMLITIIGVFTLCWLPIQIFNILVFFAPNFLAASSPTKYYVFVFSYFFCHWISCAHSMLNPLIYSFMSKNFRDDIRYIFGRFWHLYVLRKDHFRASAYSSQQQQHYLKQQQQQQQQQYCHPSAHPPVRVLHNSMVSQTRDFFGPSGAVGQQLANNNNNNNNNNNCNRVTPSASNDSHSQSQSDSGASASLASAAQVAANTAAAQSPSSSPPPPPPPLTPLVYQSSSNTSSSSSTSSSASSSLSRPKVQFTVQGGTHHPTENDHEVDLEVLAKTAALLLTTSNSKPALPCPEMHRTEVRLVANGSASSSAAAAGSAGKENDVHTSI